MGTDTKPRIALVLSGGGALGAAHIGVLRTIEPLYTTEYFVGTSAGAIIAAAAACGMTAASISDYLRQKSLLSVAFDFSLGGNGIIRGKKILDLLKKIYQDRNFEDLPSDRQLAICATDFANGDEVVVTKGNIAEAVRASLSVPVLFEPVWLNNRPLVDGGLTNNLPISVATTSYQGGQILGVDVCSGFAKTFPPRNQTRISLRQSMERSIRIFFLHQNKHSHSDTRVSVIRPDLEAYTGTDITKLKEIEEVGAKSAAEWLQQRNSSICS